MRDQADFVQQSLPTRPEPYGEVALGVECAWPETLPLELDPVSAVTQPGSR